MTMYVLVFKQGQSAVSASLAAIGGMYEDNLYLSTLYEYLDTPVRTPHGTRDAGPDPGDGIRFEDVSFTYPGATEPALDDIDAAHPAAAEARARRRERLRQDDADQAADAALRADRRPHPARRPRSARLGPDGAAPAHRRHLPGLRPLPAHGRREHRRRRRRAFRRRSALARRRRARAWPTPFIDELPDGLQHAARPVVQGRPRAVRRPVAEDRARARVHARRAPTSSCSTSRPPRWTPRPRPQIFEHFRDADAATGSRS